MLGPGNPTPVGPSVLNKGAETRLNNDRTRAAKLALGGNQAASDSLKFKHSQKRAPLQQLPQQVQQQPQAPTGNPIASLAQTAPPRNNSGAVTAPQLMVDPVGEAKAQLDIHELFSSPEFGDNVTKNTLVNYYKGLPYDPQYIANQTLQSLAGISLGNQTRGTSG